jgi:cytosine/uracil/thiamine/allantoin permease
MNVIHISIVENTIMLMWKIQLFSEILVMETQTCFRSYTKKYVLINTHACQLLRKLSHVSLFPILILTLSNLETTKLKNVVSA